MKHIQIEEGNRSCENKNASEFGSKVNNIESNTKKSTKTGNTFGNKRKYVKSSSNNFANFKKNKTCFSMARMAISRKSVGSIRD